VSCLLQRRHRQRSATALNIAQRFVGTKAIHRCTMVAWPILIALAARQ